ncbi:E3 ubiquitin-protein ligase CCNP1IP1 [Cryptococcus neoformans Bt85]|nr:E3 ubiquitin-protein ligase CCNP1IP1 [Cryptococcus neoformans var. grubii Bt85]OXM80815.1 E3 ubiquitin-protein ligase CCNP1IP1 [Cryptococcus neoformans var. grubii Bt63]
MSTSSNNELRCNNLKCRSFLSMEGQAVVTTCSHIFCISCATTLFASSLACPACNQSLQEPDDIVMTTLNPTNEYKASILAGLPPSTILEVTARAISFWTYQLSQESACQALVLKNAQDRQVCTEKQLNNAFEDLQIANKKIVSLENELDANRRKVQGIINESHRKDRELSRLRSDLEKIKRKKPFNGVAQAGEKIVEQSDPERIFSAPTMNGSTPIYRSTGRFTATPHSTHNQIPFRSQSSDPYGPIVPPLFFGMNVGASKNGGSDRGSADRRFRAARMATTNGRANF